MGSFDRVADVYRRARHRYPVELCDRLVERGALRHGSTVLDLGAGTGQLALLVADVAGTVVAMDPEADMVQVGQRATSEYADVRWVQGSDADVCELLGDAIDLVVIGNAFHHMNGAALLADLDTVVADDGAIVVCSSSVPVWLHDTDWSRALCATTAEVLGTPPSTGGVPDHDSDIRLLQESPFGDVETWVHERTADRSVDDIVGEIVSSASGAIDDDGADRLRTALDPYTTDGSITEVVTTTALISRRSGR